MMKKRKKIRLIAFSLALFVSLSAWGITGSVKSAAYKRQIDLSNQKALTELCEHLDSIEVSLIKSLYTASPSMLSSITGKLQRDCAGAKENLSELESGETNLQNTYKFLSQVGEYTAYLSRKVAAGEKISNKEYETIHELSAFATDISLEFEHMASLLSADYFTFEEISEKLNQTDDSGESTVSYLDSISDAEMTFENYPTLIYDGPFSDNILTKESEILRNSKEISKEQAKEIAADTLGVDKKFLVEENDTEGKTASYCFRTQSYDISVTKKGGYVLEILSNITAGVEKLSRADAVDKAKVFLNDLGFLDMVSTYEASDDGICTINFAYKQDSFICYPDLVKVSVSLSDGRITGFESTDYLMNHIEREIPPFGITPEEASNGLAPSLRVKKISAAVIPTDGTSEKFTYELLCEDSEGQDILVYKDISTGDEADILILLYSDNGTLTK